MKPLFALAAIATALILACGCTGTDDAPYRAGSIVAHSVAPAPGDAWAILNDDDPKYVLIAPAYKDGKGHWDYADKSKRVVKTRDYIERQYPHKVGYAAPELLTRRW